MNPKRILEMLAELAMLKFFPANNDAVLIGLSRLMVEMCHDESQVRWLVDRMTCGIYSEWPGPAEMRACFCSKFKPRDGIIAYSTVYPEGLPLSKDAVVLQISMPYLKALPPGQKVSVDVTIESTVDTPKPRRDLRNKLGGHATEQEIKNAPRWLRQLEGYE